MCGIGHTRWATHGVPSEANAHPHATAKVAVVHNGIIENFQALRAELTGQGYRFASQTDSEVIPVLITHYLEQGDAPEDAVAKAMARLKGAYAFAAIFCDHPGLLVGAQHGAPLAVGYGEGEMYLGSDAIALSHLTQRVSYLEDGDMAVLEPGKARLQNGAGKPVERAIKEVLHTGAGVGKNGYAHFMRKEIFEQPAVIAETLAVYYDPHRARFILPGLPFDLNKISRIHLVACGTSYFAALVARYWLEAIARIPVDVDIASEFRYRAPILAKDELTIVISQSGETADTLAALRYAKQFQPTLGIGKQHRAGGQGSIVDTGRAGDWRGIHQGVHHAAGNAGLFHADAGRGAQGSDAGRTATFKRGAAYRVFQTGRGAASGCSDCAGGGRHRGGA